MKENDAQTRHPIAQELNIFCFEMEAAGIMDEQALLIVQGVCYCNECQSYAALALYARAIYIPRSSHDYQPTSQ